MAILDQRHIFIGETMATKEDVLKFLAEKAVCLGIASNQETVFDSFLFREEEGTTGMLDGFAIPHAKSQVIVEASLLIVKLKTGIDWDSLDGKPTKVVIAMLIPEVEAGTTHLKLLSQVAKLLMKTEFKETLVRLQDTEEIAAYMQKKMEE